MATPIIMPKFGQMTEDSAIVEWLKKEGDKVAKGDILFTVETDKSVMEVESFEAGTLLKIVVRPGVSVPVQSTVGFLGQPGDAIPEVTAPAPAPKPQEVARAVPSAPSAPLQHSRTPAPQPPSIPQSFRSGRDPRGNRPRPGSKASGGSARCPQRAVRPTPALQHSGTPVPINPTIHHSINPVPPVPHPPPDRKSAR